MKKVHDDKLTKAIYRVTTDKCSDLGIMTLCEWLGEVIGRTPKTAANKLATGDWTVDDCSLIAAATGQAAYIQTGFIERLKQDLSDGKITERLKNITE